MGLLDDASSMLDAATGGAKTSKAEAKPVFELKDILSSPDDADAGDFGTSHPGQGDNPNPLDGGVTTEFIHFGMVHPDTGKKFPHNSIDPEKAQKVPEGHAIIFRDGVEREAIALFGFVSSTKLILKQVTEDQGALAAVGAMASNLLGGGSGKSKPDPTQLDTFLSDISSAIETINKNDIVYKDVHDAGKKLHETRATYVAFCQTLNDFYCKPPDGSNPMDMAAGAIANVPGVGNIMATVQRFAFKMQDLYLAGYLELRKNHEKTVENSAHDLTIAAIQGNYADHTPTYPIWFKKPEQKQEDPKEEEKKKDPDNWLQGAQDKVDETKKDAEDKVDDVKKSVKEKADAVYDFLGANGDPEATPGTAALAAIFGAMKGGGETTPGAIPAASDSMISGIDAAMQDIHGIPEFVKKVMTKINDTNLALLEEIYGRLMAKGIESEINSTLLLEAGRRGLTKHIVEIMGDLASGLVPGGDVGITNPIDGKKLSAQAFIAKLIEDKLIHFVDPIIQIAMGELAGEMEASRKKAQENKAQTMEVLLGRLPWLSALMFRNTFFPMWNLVVEKVFETISPQIAKVVKAVNSIFESGKNFVDTASDYQHRAEHVKDKAASGVSSLDDANQLGNSAADESQEAKDRKAQRDQQDAEKKKLDDFYKPNDKDEKFPVVSRVTDGKGEKVLEDVESVLPLPGQEQQAGGANDANNPAPAQSPIPSVPSMPSMP